MATGALIAMFYALMVMLGALSAFAFVLAVRTSQ